MWYNHLSEYLLKEEYVNNPICPLHLYKSKTGFAVITVYVDDVNLVGTLEELRKITKYLKREFEIKDLGKTKFCHDLQIKYFPIRVLVHQSTYTKKILKRFYMDKAHHLSSLMVVRSLDAKKTHFVLVKKVKNYLVLKYHIFSSLTYLANCTCLNIAFYVNL